jgi:hypothetical protein
MLECKRTEKDYDWMADYVLPEYASIHLTEASQWANQQFQTRDFVDVVLGGDTQESMMKVKAAKKYLNSMLNVKDLYHYQKYIRARSINSTRGNVVVVCSWKQRLIPIKTEVPDTNEFEDEFGDIQQVETTKTINDFEPAIDRFDYETIDPRNVRMDNKYAYSIQDKEWVTIRSELSYEQLKMMEKENSYFNLDKLRDGNKEERTETDQKTREIQSETTPLVKFYDVLERFGKMWAVVKTRDEYENPEEIGYGYDSNGDPLKNAEYIETISTVAYSGDKKVLIRFQSTPFITSKGIPYRPLVRGLCYIHPTKDDGMSDGKYSKELQMLTNDMVNMAIDRSKLSMLPTMKVGRSTWEDNDSLYFEPEHLMVCENPQDIQEFRIDGNIEPSVGIINMAIGKMQQVNSIYTTTMGDMPKRSSETATAVAGADSRSNLRANYKSLTWEYTFHAEFYWMMLQMGYQFMHPKTAMKMLGELAPAYDPEGDYTYQPVTSNIEMEYSKDKKIQRYDQLIGRIANIPNPAVIPIVALIIQRIFELSGDEFQYYGHLIDALTKTPNQDDKKEEGNAPKDAQGQPEQNQQGQPMSLQEQSARNM